MSTALLVLHMQEGVVAMCGADGAATVEPIARAIAAARANGVMVIHVPLEYRTGSPESNPRTRGNPFTRQFQQGMPAGRIHQALTPAGDDLIVASKRASPFIGNDLELLLRAQGVRRLALAGLGTSGVVLATFIAAADLDYELVVLRDGCADPSPDLHRLLFEIVFSRRAEAITVDEWAATLA